MTMSVVQHAKDELERAGTFREDPAFAQCILSAVAAFGSYSHSGTSAAVGIHAVNELLQFKALSPLTSNPDEWMEVQEGLWQSRRDPSYFSSDGGETWTNQVP